MTKIQIELPDLTAKAASEAGLLTPQALDRLLTEALRRRQAAEALLGIADRVAEAGIEPMSMDEINAEVKAFRAERQQRAAVLDTNVLLSGLLWHGTPHALIEQVRAGTLTLVSSPTLIAELAGILTRAKFQTALIRANTNPEQILAELRLLVEIADPPPLPAPVSRDPDDDAVLALAVAVQVDFIVSGDGHLLVLNSYEGVPIVTPVQALAIIGA